MTKHSKEFSEEEIQRMLDNLDAFSQEEVVEINRLVDELAIRRENALAYNDLIEFCKRMMPEFLVGNHTHYYTYYNSNHIFDWHTYICVFTYFHFLVL